MIADYIRLRADRVGWTLLVFTEGTDDTPAQIHEFTVGDVIQFTEETERTLGRWLADGPADFHNATVTNPMEEALALLESREAYTSSGEELIDEAASVLRAAVNPDLVRDLERGK